MIKRKRIIAILLAATLVMSGALLAGAAEVDDSQTTDDSQETEEADEETVETLTEDNDAAEEEETVLVEESVTDEDVSDVDDSVEMEVGEYTGMKEIAEIDPELLGPVEESDSGIQPFAMTAYTYKYTYTTLDFSSTGGRSGDAILDLAVELIVGNEGGYNTVTPNDNGSGAMSIGKIQWWADSALLLARLIVAEDNQTAYKYLGESLYNEITSSSTSWSKRTLNDSEVTKMKNFLDPNKNPASKTIQDKLARSYIAVYVNHGYGLGIRNAAALVYYADIENQYGYSGGKMGAAKACAEYAYNIAESWSSVTLNELHLAAISNVAHNYTSSSSQKGYINRRRSTYGELVSSGWTYCNSGDYTIPYDENGYAGAAWLKNALNIYRNAGLTVNNSYDDALKSAVKSYQKAIGVTQDGMAGRYTSTKLIHDMYYTSMQTKGASPKVDGFETDIVKINGTWTYTVNGEPDYTYTGVAKNSNGWYYIKNGVLDRSYTGLAKNSNGWWYISSGKLDRSYTGFAKNENGSWYMTNGKLMRKDNTVLKDTKGAIGAKNEWYYVVGSKVQSDFTGLANYKNASGWWYIKNGKVDRSANTVAKNKNGWYYVLSGKVQKDFTGLADYSNASGWWYIKNGKVDRSYKGLAKNKNGWFYLQNGKVDRSYTGFAKNDNGSWYMTNGKLTRKNNTVYKDTMGALGSEDDWYYVIGSKVQSDFTGLADYANSSGWWYITKGKVDRSFTGVASNKNGQWYIKNGKVQKSYTGTVTYNGKTYSVINGKATANSSSSTNFVLPDYYSFTLSESDIIYAGKDTTQLETPIISGSVDSSGNIRLQWDAVPGAEKYRVFRKKYGDSSWTKLGDTKNTSYTTSTGSSAYYYTVRCVSSDGSTYMSDYVKGFSGSAVVGYALQFVGNPYVWAGISLTNGCDCSGFVMQVYAHFGVALPHYSGDQIKCGAKVDDISNAQPGDIIGRDRHVVLYMGNDMIVQAPGSATGIVVTPLSATTYTSIRRIFN